MSVFDALHAGPASQSVEDQLLWIEQVRDAFLQTDLPPVQAMGKSLTQALVDLRRAQEGGEDVEASLESAFALIDSAQEKVNQELILQFEQMRQGLIDSLRGFPEGSADRYAAEQLLATCELSLSELRQPAPETEVISGVIPSR